MKLNYLPWVIDIKRCGFYKSYAEDNPGLRVGCMANPYKCRYYHNPFKYFCPWKEVVDYERNKVKPKQSISDYIITRCFRFLRRI